MNDTSTPDVDEDLVDLTRLLDPQVPRYAQLTSHQVNEARRILYRRPDSVLVEFDLSGGLIVAVGAQQIVVPREPPAGRPGLQLLAPRAR